MEEFGPDLPFFLSSVLPFFRLLSGLCPRRRRGSNRRRRTPSAGFVLLPVSDPPGNGHFYETDLGWPLHPKGARLLEDASGGLKSADFRL